MKDKLIIKKALILKDMLPYYLINIFSVKGLD